MTKQQKNKNRIATAVFVVSLVLVIAPHFARAGWLGDVLGIGDIASNVVGWIVYVITYIISAIFGFLVSILVYIISFILQISVNVVNSPAVQSGESVTLAIANLGFVLAIIIIALATILRQETYGVKQILWKLVVAAILVNFSLPIAGVIIGFSNSFSTYFMKALPGGGGAAGFADALAGAFSPHRPFLDIQLDPNATATSVGVDAGATLASIVTPLYGLVFALAMLTVTIITLATLVAMLLIRYITLSILLILMPLVWLLWIFPAFSSHFSKWWSEFLRWTFFAPIVIFFLYLSISTASLMSAANKTASGTGASRAGLALVGFDSASDSGLLAGIKGFAKGAAAVLIGDLMQMIVVLGLAIGGFVAANKLSITGASVGMGAMKAVRGAVQGWAVKKGKRAASYPLRTEMGRKLTERLQTAGLGRGRLGRALLKPVREAGTAAAKAREPTEKMVSEKNRELGKLSLEEQARRIGTQDAPGKLAIMRNLQKSMKSGDAQESAAAQAAFDNLPADIKGKMDKLNLLYGKGGKGPGLQETFAGVGGGGIHDRLRDEADRRGAAGENVEDLNRIAEAVEAGMREGVGELEEAIRTREGRGENVEALRKIHLDLVAAHRSQEAREAVGAARAQETAGIQGAGEPGASRTPSGARNIIGFDAQGKAIWEEEGKT